MEGAKRLESRARPGRIRPCAFCRGRTKIKQPRRFNGHARRLPRGQRPEQPGELVQIDHLSASRDSKQLKEFKAVSPIGKQMVVQVFSCATAHDTTRVEFWNRFDGDFTVEAANRALADYQRFYHQVRPHQALDFMTPDEYLQKNKDSPSQSHMC